MGSLLGGYGKCVVGLTFYLDIIMWQSQVENGHYSTVSGLIQLVIISRMLYWNHSIFSMSLYEYYMHSKFQSHSYWQSLVIAV